MARLKKFSRIIELFDVDHGKAIEVTESLSPQYIILTLNSKFVARYELKSGKLCSSWSVRSCQQITVSAVADHCLSQYVAVCNHQVLYQWKEDDKAIDSGTKTKLSSPVYGLYGAYTFGVVLVYSNATLALSHKPLEIAGEPADDDICKATTLIHNNQLIVMIWLRTHIRIFTLNGLSSKFSCSVVIDSSHVYAKASVAHQQNLNTLSLSIHNSGDLVETVLTGPLAGQSRTLYNVIGLSSDIHMVSLNESYIAIAGIGIGLNQLGVGLWDKKFGLLQAWQAFPENVHDAAGLYCQGYQLLLASPSGIYSYGFSSHSSNLRAVLGKFIVPPNAENLPNNIQKIVNDLIHALQERDTASFQLSITSLLAADEVKTGSVPKLCDCLSSMWQYILADPSIISPSTLTRLLELGLATRAVTPELMKTTALGQHFALLYTCLTCLPDISEKDLLVALNAVLAADDEAMKACSLLLSTEDDSSVATEVQCPFPREKATFVNAILTKPFNDVFILECVRGLDIGRSLMLLNYLQYLLHLAPLSTSPTMPSLIKVVDWLNLVLDANFAQLVLTPDAKVVLVHLHAAVQEQVYLHDELMSLETVLAQLRERCVLPSKQNPGLYNIHVLHVC